VKVQLKYILLIVSLLANSYLLRAQSDNIRFSHLDINDGLSHNTVSKIIQDHKGFMWFATNDGLNKYNGFDFEIFSTSENGTKSLSDNFITHLFQDSKNRIWIGTRSGGVNVYDYETESFTSYSCIQPHKPTVKTPPSNFITDIVEDKDGNIWISSFNGLSLFNEKNKTFTHFNTESSPFKLSNVRVISLMLDTQNQLWLGYNDGKIEILDIKTQIIKPFNFGNLSITNSILSLYQDKKQNIYIGTDGDGLFVLPKTTKKLLHYTSSEYTATSNRTIALKNNVIRDISENYEGYIWIATDGGGLHRYNTISMDFKYFNHSPYDTYSISNDAVYCVYEDRERNLWVGTIRGGIDIFKRNRRNFTHYQQQFTNPNSLVFNNVVTFAEAPDHKIWIGTDGGGLSIFNPIDNSFENNIIASTKIRVEPQAKITAIFFASETELWLVSYGAKLSRINLKTGSEKIFIAGVDNAKNLTTNKIWKVFKDSAGEIWICTHGGGICKYNSQTDNFINYTSKPDDETSLSDNYLSCILDAENGYFWIGTYSNGLNYFDTRTGKCKVLYHNPLDNKTLSKNSITCLHQTDENSLWVGTDGGGLNLLDIQTNKFTHFSEKNDFPNNSILGILEDNENNLWMSTNKGLLKFNKETENLLVFDKYDGLQSNQFLKGSYLVASDGCFYFGGINGFNTFHPNKIRANKTNTKVLITAFKLMYEKLEVGDTRNNKVVLKKTISEIKKIELKYHQNSFEFEFITLDFTAPKKCKYKYKLQNFDKNFIETTSSKRYAAYTNIPSGNYLFQVIAANSDGEWSMEPTTIEIVIEQPFWLKWWFIAFVGILGISIVVSAYRYRVVSIKRRNENLEKQVAERTSEIQEQKEELNQQSEELKLQTEVLQISNSKLESLNATKDKFFSIIAHDIKNPLSAFLTVSDLLKDQYNEISEDDKLFFISEINQKAKRLYSLLENLLQWAISQSGRISFNPDTFNLKEMVVSVISLFSTNAEQKNINIVTNIDNQLSVWADMNMISTVLRNLISNAIKFTQQGGRVSVDAKAVDGKVQISIKDSGIGISSEDVQKLFRIEIDNNSIGNSKEKGTGLGLILCKEFVEKNNGEIGVSSSIGRGTTFTFTVPLSKKH